MGYVMLRLSNQPLCPLAVGLTRVPGSLLLSWESWDATHLVSPSGLLSLAFRRR